MSPEPPSRKGKPLTAPSHASEFPAHGHSDAQVQGHVLHVSARGPFNAEGMTQLKTAMLSAYRDLPLGSRVVNVSEMLETLVFPPEAWEELRATIRATSASGHQVLATAWVVATDVEGRRLMLPKARALFSECGRRFEIFETREAAEAWAQDVLNESQTSSGQQP